MSHEKDDKDKTNAFVDFLLEEEDDDLQLIPTGEVDESAMDFDAELEASSDEDVELDMSIDSEEDTQQTDSKTLEGAEETIEAEASDEHKDFSEGTGKLSSKEFPTQITELDEKEIEEVAEEKVVAISHDYPTAVSEQPVIEEPVIEEPEVEESTAHTEIEAVEEEDVIEIGGAESNEEHTFNPVTVAENTFTSKTSLQSSENLKKAQDKIIELENEIERLRMENQELGAAGEVLKRKTEELATEVDRIGLGRKDAEGRLKDEIQHSQMRLQGKQQEIQDLKVKVESLELRLKRDLQMVRVRERELENRLELVKLENSAVLRSKDEHILELKRKLDQNQIESEQLKDKIRKLATESDEKQDKIRRTVRTLRLALNMLDEEEAKEVEQELKKSG